MDRLYLAIIQQHLAHNRQMIFLAGPRQVGKTTCSKLIQAYCSNFHYLNWDNREHRKLIIKGANELVDYLGLAKAMPTKLIIVFDEIHKYKKWKQFLKGFFDLYEEKCQIVVTGSAKLDVYHREGDSLMGRYFIYHMHPLSIAELLSTEFRMREIAEPRLITSQQFDNLFKFGGFPELFMKADKRFFFNWQRMRKQQLLKEDIRELSQVQEIAELEYLLDILVEEASQMLNVASIANQLNIAESTIHRWIKILKSFYYCYTLQPWYKNVRRSLRKTPKIYLWDWSTIGDVGQRFENFIASHLYKAVQYWTDMGFGEYGLYYLRDKEKREVDFLVIKNKIPWFLVEAKMTDNKSISKNLHYYQQELNVPHAFQVVYDANYVDIDCFSFHEPIIVPASTFLSQLV